METYLKESWARTNVKERKESNGLVWYEWRGEDGVRHIELTGEGFWSNQALPCPDGVHRTSDCLKAEFLGSESWARISPFKSAYEILLGEEDCNVYAPSTSEGGIFGLGEEKSHQLFLVFRKKAIPEELCEVAMKGLRGAARPSKNRGIAGGKVEASKLGREEGSIIPSKDGTRARYISKDGIVSDTVEANMTMGGIAGFFPATARNPYVRLTAFTRDNYETFQGSFPFLQKVHALYEETSPESFRRQQTWIQSHGLDAKGWTLADTVFSTITVNKNFQTAVHQDEGDLKAGMECFAVLEGGKGTYDGGYTCFPQFRVAFDARTGDFVAFDVAHYWHGNLPMTSRVEGEDEWERISLVMYMREDMSSAGTREEEDAKYRAWASKARNPVEQHEFRKGEKAKTDEDAADFFAMFTKS